MLKAGENRRPGHVVLKAGSEDTRGAYALRENTIPPGFVVNPHRHQAVDEAWYVLEGEVTFLVENDVVTVPEGGFVLVPRGVIHAFTNRSSAPTRFLVVFSPPGFEEMFEELLELRARGQSTPERVREIGARYETEDVEVAPGSWPP